MPRGRTHAERPHQALDGQRPVSPADRFTPTNPTEAELVPLWLPPTITPAPGPVPTSSEPADREADNADGATAPGPERGGVGSGVEFDRVVPPAGNMQLAGRQLWLGPARSGQVVRFWADTTLIHLFIGGTRVKTVRSHLTVTDLAALIAAGAVPAGPSPLPPVQPGDAVEVERVVSRGGTVVLGGHAVLAAEILAGRQIGIRIERDTLMFFDLDTRELLRVRPNPLRHDQIVRLRGNRPAGPPPRPSTEPVRVQRRVSSTGVITVCRQTVSLGRTHQHRTVTVHVSDTTLAIELDDGETRIIRRTTTIPVRNIKADRPRSATTQVV